MTDFNGVFVSTKIFQNTKFRDKNTLDIFRGIKIFRMFFWENLFGKLPKKNPDKNSW